MNVPEINSVITDIRTTLSQHPGLVKRAGVFGSLATGKFTDTSDIDIAIEFAHEDDFELEKFSRFCEICEHISENISNIYGRKVDLIHVEDNPRSFLHEIRGEIVWA